MCFLEIHLCYMNVHKPFTTNLVILECDFNLCKMAQTLIDMENKIHTKALSDVCHVRVTQQGYVQFVMNVREGFFGNRVVQFMRNNWHSYVTIARPHINKVMKASENLTLKYHANTKVVKALKGDNRKYSMYLLMHSLKGKVRMDLCIYLNEEEYNNLEHSISEINQWIQDISIPTH